VSQGPEDFTPRRYEVRHRTTYTYDGPVESCYERGFLAPRETPTQRVVINQVHVSPEPHQISEHVDHFGNQSFYVEVRTPHNELVVEKTSVLDVAWKPVDLDALNRWTVLEAAGVLAEQGDPVERAEFLLPSPLVQPDPAVVEYSRSVIGPQMPLGDALIGITRGIFRDFEYRSGATTVRTTLPELLDLRAGVCQDFAHLALGCLRSLGLPARYVSGYLETQPPPGQKKLEGSDASHAWLSVQVPGGTWVDLDPTNDHLCDSRYVVTAWGRDFRDVSPLKGVVFSEAKNSSLKVAVDVNRVEALI
jgi:transglutaminase-like putative cysteine protease